MKEIFKNDWQEILEEEFEKDYYKDLRKLLIDEYKHYEIFPKAQDIFNAFHYTAYKDVKVLILGQDPYHNVGQAHGLAFSVKEGVAIPPSLRNIYKELKSDLGLEIPRTGYLKAWADQGIMLLNTTLTVRAHQPMSHSKIGWEIFTNAVIEKISEKEGPVVFILWGNHAKARKKFIRPGNHLIIEGVHPSPLSASRGFFGSRPFSRANEFLKNNGVTPPTWEVK
ncbi:MAG: uracil-DNA glycosylase [Peptoniphilus harei]|uniref:uracil-DNA glycosylase n=1 Tax=Peptoniphilus sp. TaxID=1971214 RepID=UPI002911E62A|nr:uracil-DNA glycosylase [Peptoniphilus harei]